MSSLPRLLARSVAVLGLSASTAAAQTMYLTGDNGTTLVSLNTATGVATRIGSFGTFDTFAGAFTSDGQFWTITNGYGGGSLASVNLTTGQATPIGALGGSGAIMALGGVGTSLYAAGWDGKFYGVDRTTGAVSFIGNTGFSYAMDLAVAPDGTMYGVGMNDLYSIDLTTGAGTFVANVGAAGDPMSAAFRDANHLILNSWSSGSQVFEMDMTTHAITAVGTGAGVPYIHGGDILVSSTATPEPATVALLATGLAGVAAAARRRRTRTA